MTPKPSGGAEPSFLEGLARILEEEALDAAMAAGVRLLAAAAKARWAALFLADGNEPLREFWHSESLEDRDRIRPAFKSAALEAVRTGSIVAAPIAVRDIEMTPRVYPLSSSGRALGAVCLAAEPGTDPGGPKRERQIQAIATVLAHKARVHEESVRSRAQRARDERWFKTLDGHLRVLDRERQKFAAFVNQTDILVYVTDVTRAVRWTNRAMSDLFPPEGGQTGWAGKECQDVCTRVGRACGRCPVAEAVEQGRVVHHELRSDAAEDPSLHYLTALPIVGPNGKTAEVMVVIQDLTGLEGLRRSESRYRLLFERNVDGIVMVDPESYRFVLANEAACSLLGYSQAELMEQKLPDLHSPAEWARVQEAYRQSPAHDAAGVPECVVRTRFGEERLTQVWSTRLDVEGQEVLMVNFRDITEQRRAERDLARAEERLHTVVAGAPIVLFAVDRDGVFTLSEGRGLAPLGLAPGQVVGHSVFVLYKDSPDIAAYMRRALGGEDVAGEVEVEGFTFEARYSPLRDAAGEIQGVIGVATDVTERRKAERALRDSETRKGAILDTALDCIVTIDREGKVTEFNRAAEQTFGYTREEALGREFAELVIPPSQRRAHRDGMAQYLATGEGAVIGRRVETMAMRADGTEFPVELAVARIPGSEPACFAGTIRDLRGRRKAESALRQSEDKLRQAQKMEAVGLLAGGVAHDFNNLLTIIATQSDLLSRSLPAGSEARAKAEEIRAASERGSLLTRQLLTFSRNEVLTPEVLDMNSVVREIEGLLRRLLGEDVELSTATAPDPIHVRGDRGQIEQVILNLAVNARDAMPTGGRLRIGVGSAMLDEASARDAGTAGPGPYCALTVEDSGCGMDAETQQRIFEPFFTTKERGKGTGLGLSTVYGIVKQGGGSITVSSEPGGGTTFTVYLPREASGMRRRPAAPELGPMCRGTETVLLVEDEPGVRAIGRELLEMNGYRVLEAENGARALEVSEGYEGSIHLLVSDVVMPQMGGRELADRLLALRPGIRVLLVSGFIDDTMVRQGVADAGIAFLQKPFTLETLSQKVREVLDTRKPLAPPPHRF